LLPQKYSPTQRSLDAYGMRLAGARHGHHKTAYKLNSLGLPEKVMLYSKQLEIPSDISVEIIDNEHIYDEEYGNVNMAYDESGTRIWESTYTRGGYQGSNVTIPGIGIYRKETLAGDFKLTHLDLVGGGFRKGLAEEAIYPMVDAQGNVRAYASASGIKSAYDYRPFGRVEELEENAVADERRWQGKEYDGQHGKYYFGARYFDPFFGMWMSPDPAGQFANPYTYGGDPINFVDPTGLFALDLGFASIGWDSKRGWNFSLSSPIMSYTWNQNGSKTYEASVGGSYQWWIVSLGAEMGYSYNTYSGHSLSTGGHVCVGVKKGEAGVCAGVEAGGSLYWDPYGNYLGATAYAGAFAQAQTSDNSSVAKLNGGYETGLMGMEGRGLYAGGNLNAGVSLYASWAENGGWNYGGGYKFEAWSPGSLLVADRFDAENNFIDMVAADMPDSKENERSYVFHGDLDGKSILDDENTALTLDGRKIASRGTNRLSARKFYDEYVAESINEKTTMINLYVCLAGYGNNSFGKQLADIVRQETGRSIVVRAPNGYVQPYIKVLGVNMFFNKNRLTGKNPKGGPQIKSHDLRWNYFVGGI